MGLSSEFCDPLIHNQPEINRGKKKSFISQTIRILNKPNKTNKKEKPVKLKTTHQNYSKEHLF
jgi:hypothetical protein